MKLGLEDRVCVVTGSTAGIGLETARLLAAEGAQVVVSGRDPERVEAARAEVGAALGVAGDLALPDAPAELIARAGAELGQVDCLVNNVGLAVQVGFDELSDADWESIWQLHVMRLDDMVPVPLGETRDIDDQVEWLDNSHVLYGYDDPQTGRSAIYQAAIDGQSPELYVANAESPAVSGGALARSPSEPGADAVWGAAVGQGNNQ